jgi:hypothetical protein
MLHGRVVSSLLLTNGSWALAHLRCSDQWGRLSPKQTVEGFRLHTQLEAFRAGPDSLHARPLITSGLKARFCVPQIRHGGGIR